MDLNFEIFPLDNAVINKSKEIKKTGRTPILSGGFCKDNITKTKLSYLNECVKNKW